MGGKNLLFWTEISVNLGNGMIYAYIYYKFLKLISLKLTVRVTFIARLLTEYRQTPLHVQNRIRVQMHQWLLVETTYVTEFEYYFACTRKGVHLYSVMSPGKMIFAVLEL